MNCLIIAGEKSGEEHCLSFLPSIQKGLPELQLWGVGGDELKKRGMELIYHLNDFSSWGVSDVVGKIPFYLKALKKIEEQVDQRKCKVAILIDFQGFNLKLATSLKKKGVVILYYVAPQAWAWKAYRAKSLARCVHTLFTLIPFEKEWFESRGVSRVFGVTHPIYNLYKQYLPVIRKEKIEKPNILLLPGSRESEVKFMLPLFLQALDLIKKQQDVKVSLVLANSLSQKWSSFIQGKVDCLYASENLPLALKDADMALSCSGTVTLTCALFRVPSVVCYKIGLVNEALFRLLVPYRGFISLANIVHQKEVFPEYIQEEVHPKILSEKLIEWLDHPSFLTCKRSELASTEEKIKGEMMEPGLYMKDMIERAYR